MKRFENFAAIEINWLCYGSGGAKNEESGSVTERFKYHSAPNHTLNRHIKSIVNPRRIFCFIGCHEAATILSDSSADSHGAIVKKSFWDREPQHDVIRINHYAVKSYEEFLAKRERGRARTLGKRNLDYFERFDLNQIKEQ